MITEFYYGSSWHWPLDYIPRAMLSYNYLRTIKHPWNNINIPWMMDSGAYSVILKYGKYPYMPEQYAEGIKAWRPDISWTMDYPCEQKVREAGKYTPLTAQDMTIRNQISLLDQGVETQMVVQGYEPDEYLENLDKIKSAGLLTQHLGIGSICRRGQVKEIARIIRLIHNNVPGWVKLHGFGIKTSVLAQTDARFYLYSADSQSWDYEARYGAWLNGKYNGQTYKDKIPRLQEYVSRIEFVLEGGEPLYNFEVKA
jgi:hypothetical protein